MQTHHDKELAELMGKLLAMGSRAEGAVAGAVQALLTRDEPLARQVRESDGAINLLEIEIDDLGVRLLAKAPLATDLRFILVTMRASQNLERIGDEARKIANRARDLAQEAPLKTACDFQHYSAAVLVSLKSALDALVRRDTEIARALILRDKEMNRLNKQFHAELTELMTQDPTAIRRCLALMVVSKSLERIADHAKNIAEEVVYLRDAQDIRHPRFTTAPAA